MALGGGTFLVQNKKLPGAYINYASKPRAVNVFGDRGYCAIALPLDWGKKGITTIDAADLQRDSLELFGYNYTDPQLRPLRELMRNAKTAYIGNLNTGANPATTTIGENLTVTANYGGVRGNDIQIAVENDIDDDGFYKVTTYFDRKIVDVQKVETVDELKPNFYVTFKGTGEPTETAGTKLTAGSNGEVDRGAHADFLEELEAYYFNTVGYAGTDESIKGLYSAYVERLRDRQGIKCTAVVYDDKKSNYMGVISVITAPVEEEAGLVYWLTGAEAGCEINESLTNKRYDGEYTINKRYKQRDLEEAIEKGKLVFHVEDGEYRILEDINTFTEFSVTMNVAFSKNQTIRVLDEIAMSAAKIFNKYHIGKTPNDEDGRIALWDDLVTHAKRLLKIRAIQNFEAEDIEVKQGFEPDDVEVTYNGLQVVMAMARLYMTIRIV